MFTNAQYSAYSQAIRNKPLPLAFVDLDFFDANIKHVQNTAQDTGKTIRVGTKSIRCEPLTRRIFELGGPTFQGLLTYTAAETAWLAGKGYDDFIIAYPTVQKSDLDLIVQMARAGKKVLPMVDNREHLKILSEAAKNAGVELPLCLEVDMSYRPFKSSNIHLGIRRSPLRTPEDALNFAREAKQMPGISIKAIMGYEGHIASAGDTVPGKFFKNAFLKAIKKRSINELNERRQAIVKALHDEGVELEIVNGGGSGSLPSSLKDPSLTEVTVGSGFFSPALFHHFAEIKYQPSAFFAIQVVRFPAPGIITCLGGGYPASGPAGEDKLPLPVLPVGLQYLPLEGAGEVQTPLVMPRDCPQLNLGDPVIFQHAKGGELSERFSEYLLLQNHEVVGNALTYRGEGNIFL